MANILDILKIHLNRRSLQFFFFYNTEQKKILNFKKVKQSVL